MKSKEECLTALRNATKFGNLSADQLSKMSREDAELFRQELYTYMKGGLDDASRDEAQAARLNQLAADLATAL